MNLEQTATALAEQFPEELPHDLDRKERLLERFGQIAFGGFLVMIGIAILGILYAIVTKMILSGDNPWAGSLMAAFIVFAGLTLAYVVINEDLKEKKKAKRITPVETAELDAARAFQLTEGTPFPIPSVIENTTDLLPVDNKTRKL